MKFIFQPAEELPPAGEEGGAKLMIEEGALENPAPDAIFGLHVTSHAADRRDRLPRRARRWRAPTPSASPSRGRQTHGAMPWRGVDPIVTAAQVVLGLQTIVSRQVDITHEPAVVTVGAIKGGVRENIIPDSVEMRGTIRTFDEAMRDDIHARVKDTAEHIARAARAGCEVCITKNYPVTVNDAELTEAMLPTLERVAGPAQVRADAQGHRLGGLLVLPARRSRPVLLRRRHAGDAGPGDRAAEPLAALLHRRSRAAARRSRARARRGRLARGESDAAADR